MLEFCENKQAEYQTAILEKVEDKMKRGFKLALEEQCTKTVPENIGVTSACNHGGVEDDAQSKTSRISSDPPTGHMEDPPHRPPSQPPPTTILRQATPMPKHPFDGNQRRHTRSSVLLIIRSSEIMKILVWMGNPVAQNMISSCRHRISWPWTQRIKDLSSSGTIRPPHY